MRPPPSSRTLLAAPSSPSSSSTRTDASHTHQSRAPHRARPADDALLNEKLPSDRSSRPMRSSGPQRQCSRSGSPAAVQHTYGYPAPSRTPLPAPCTLSDSAPSSQAWERFKPWLPITLWVLTTLGFFLAIAFWRTEVFNGLDDFSHWLQGQGWTGYTVLGVLIFVTTIPPFPLYSTFMTLSGYCFGALPGAVLSYVASLCGAVAVFLVSRAYLKEYINSFIQCSPTFKRVLRAIERRPNVLFLVRLAPYPYNVISFLLAASPTLTLQTYTTCTALALFKVIIHTTIGAGIHSFSHHGSNDGSDDDSSSDEEDENAFMSRALQVGGILLCIGVFIYISWVARRAVDNEADDDEPSHYPEERVAFLSSDPRTDSSEMTEAGFAPRLSFAEESTTDLPTRSRQA